MPPASWSGTPTRDATPPTASRLTGRAGPRAVEVDEVDDLGAHRHEPLGDPLGPVGRRADAGRGAGPEHGAGSAGLQVDGGDDLHRQARDAGRDVRTRRPGWRASGRGLVSASAARTASIVVSMSASVTP